MESILNWSLCVTSIPWNLHEQILKGSITEKSEAKNLSYKFTKIHPINQSFLVDPRKEERIKIKLLFSLQFVETGCSGHQKKI